MLWVDKHRPKLLEQLDYHKDLSARLQKLAGKGDIPHLLFLWTRWFREKAYFSPGNVCVAYPYVSQLKVDQKTFKTPSNRVVELRTISSNFHVEINPGEAGIYDRYVVQEVIKEMAQHTRLDSGKGFKVLVLSEVDRLTKDAQAALRRTMEKYTKSCRLVLCCRSPSRVIEPVRSRCLGIRIAAPTQGEIMSVLESVATKESLSLPKPLAARIANAAQRNLRRAILLLECCKVEKYPFTNDQKIRVMDWEAYLGTLTADILTEQTPSRLLTCRAKLYELLVNCIPADVIIKALVVDLCKRIDNELVKHEITSWGAYYEHHIHKGQKEIFHLEAFVAKTMAILVKHHR